MAQLTSKDVAVAAIFAALSIAIPLFFQGTLQITIPAVGYSATVASHVPVILSTLFGPLVSAIVALASALGFFATLGPVVGARAATHVIWVLAIVFAMKKGLSFPKALFIVGLPLHATLEGLVVLPFGIPWQGALINVAGTAIHHVIDSIVALAVYAAALPLIRRFRYSSEKQATT